MKMNSVNVLGMESGNVLYLRAYSDNPEGNKQAEASFRRLIRNHTKVRGVPNPEELEAMVEDGYYSDEQGYELFLIHSV